MVITRRRVRCVKCGTEFDTEDVTAAPVVRCARFGCGAVFVMREQPPEYGQPETPAFTPSLPPLPPPEPVVQQVKLEFDIGGLKYTKKILFNGSKRFSFGRSDKNDIVIPAATTSSFHGYFYVENQLLYICDAGSKNGLYINGVRIRTDAPLYPGDIIYLGNPNSHAGQAVSIRVMPSGGLGRMETVPINDAAGSRFAAKTITLTGLTGYFAGRTVQIGRNEPPVIIGRDSKVCTLIYPETENQISAQHCSLFFDAAANSFCLKDLGSVNGTYINDGVKLTPNKAFSLVNNTMFYPATRKNLLTVKI
ncbi:MAG: FHA domain-containing protein [Clostridiales bacterium]|jgi:pSer/pThr/pTyr-binding forkhead associated (FHA) protein/DNA-directed RNA polymerase subunit RPC12/RpoP|nr:FHA domain-containing protein [Clostridiales bacterium]